MKSIHGGDWAGFEREYGTRPLDFSANVSPLGLPAGVRAAVIDALEGTDRYPDPMCRELRAALAEHHGVPASRIVCGNGASELIWRLCLALRPKKAAVFAPSFAEYALALRAADCEVTEIPLPAADFRMTEDCIRMIPHDCELVFLCNPNNPTGLLTEKGLLQSLSERCRKIGSVLAVDECFLDFCAAPEAYSLVEALAAYPNLVILKAFTKTCAMAGLRLGYALCGNEALASRLQSAGPPWAVSHIAQAAGAAALWEKDYGSKLRKTVSAERRRMIDALVRLGLRVIPGEANFLLFQSGGTTLADRLRTRGILIRDCANFAGLSAGWYRTAIRTAEENSALLNALSEVLHG